MKGLVRRPAEGSGPARQTLDGFVDALLQNLENGRAALDDGVLARGEAETFFARLYESERPRLQAAVSRLGHLGTEERQSLYRRVDERMRQVVLPAYARLASRFTLRERNDFFLLPEKLHGLERAGFAGLGLLLGLFVVWAPFIPLWSKEWVLVFLVGGLVFPGLRRVLALRRYQQELNQLVRRTDDEIWRLDLDYVVSSLGGA